MSLNNFAAIDFETANENRNSACALSIVNVENLKVKKCSTFLIKPPGELFTFSHIHNIRYDDVKNEKTFDLLWPQINELLQNVNFIAAHNVTFDRSVLFALFGRYQITAPDYRFLCTVQLARRVWQIFPTNLPSVCNRLSISLNHHDPESDALACANIIIKASNHGEIIHNCLR